MMADQKYQAEHIQIYVTSGQSRYEKIALYTRKPLPLHTYIALLHGLLIINSPLSDKILSDEQTIKLPLSDQNVMYLFQEIIMIWISSAVHLLLILRVIGSYTKFGNFQQTLSTKKIGIAYKVKITLWHITLHGHSSFTVTGP